MENFSIKSIKHFITITKITLILIAFIHLINEIVSFLGFNDIPLNYIGGISLIPIIYLYYTSFVFKLCSYYRMMVMMDLYLIVGMLICADKVFL